MAGVFVYSDETNLAKELISFAKETGKEAYAITFSQKAAEDISNFGCNNVFVLKGDSPVAENYGKAIAEFLKSKNAELFVVGATPRGRDLAARVAGYLGCGMASDVLSLGYSEEKIIVEKMMYGGVTVQNEVLEGLSVVTVPSGKFEAIAGESSEIITVDVQADNRVSLISTAPIVKEGADLSTADKVVGIGLGMEKKEDIKIAEDLAAALGADLGCSRSIAEERKWLPVEQYIGISGAVIKPQLYLAMGISGQIQHVIGVRDSKIIVAVDINEKAPIFKAADYGIVGDMYEIIPLLTEAIKNAH